MSRTIRNRTQSNGLNGYAWHKHKESMERWRKWDDTDERAVNNFLTFYRRDGYGMRRSGKMRRAFNRSQKSKCRETIRHSLKYDSFDNLATIRWRNASRYYY